MYASEDVCILDKDKKVLICVDEDLLRESIQELGDVARYTDRYVSKGKSTQCRIKWTNNNFKIMKA